MAQMLKIEFCWLVFDKVNKGGFSYDENVGDCFESAWQTWRGMKRLFVGRHGEGWLQGFSESAWGFKVSVGECFESDKERNNIRLETS